jgi:hypothetical protein
VLEFVLFTLVPALGLQERLNVAGIIILKERLAEIKAALDDLQSGNNVQGLDTTRLLLPAKEVISGDANVQQLLREEQQTTSRLTLARARFQATSKAVEREESENRTVRIQRVVTAFSLLIEREGTDNEQRYESLREEEGELARLLLDERTREGELLANWFGFLSHRPPLTDRDHEEVVDFLLRFSRGCRKQYELPPAREESLFWAVQRVLFPRIWNAVTHHLKLTLSKQVKQPNRRPTAALKSCSNHAQMPMLFSWNCWHLCLVIHLDDV